MDSFPPAHDPARHLDDLVDDLGVDEADDHPEDGPPPELPEVVEAVTGRARDLHRLADQLGADRGDRADHAGDATLPAVALLRAHAGKVDDLAEHLLAAGSERAAPEPGVGAAPVRSGSPEPGRADTGPTPPGPSGSLTQPPRGVPRSVG